MAFDYVVQEKNKNNKIIRENHYRRTVTNGEVRLEQPPGSGKWFTEDGKPIVTEEKKADPKRG